VAAGLESHVGDEAVKKGKAPPAAARRPRPPASVLEGLFEDRFEPAHDVGAWVRSTFLEEGGDLHNPDHQHLTDVSVGFLWASQGLTKAGRRVIGLTEDLQASMRGNAWQAGRATQQMREWFGAEPRFVITLDAQHCAECTDVEFCALIEHELFHCGHKRDEFGELAYTKDGQPKLYMRPHDVEEFVGVVARYGVGDPGSNLAKMIIAAAKGPTVAPIRIAQACGTCMLRAA